MAGRTPVDLAETIRQAGEPLSAGVTPSVEGTPVRYPTLHRTAKIADLEIFYREAGARGAPTILLLHGFPSSSHMFRALIPALSDQYHVVAPDYPGFGYSSMPSVDEFEYTFDRLAHITDQLVQRLGLTKYSLYAMDYGAPIGFRLAAKHPERIQALIVQNGNAYEEGLRDFWKPFRSYWSARTEANAAPLRKLLALDATKWQYTNGTRNREAISPDNWLVDQSLLDRPETTRSNCSSLSTTARIPRCTPCGSRTFAHISRPRWWCGGRTTPSSQWKARCPTRGT